MTGTKALAAISIFGAICVTGAAQAQDAGAAIFRATTLNLSAIGEVKAPPDQATITLGVRTTGKTAADAMRANRDLMNTTVAALTAQGIAKKDIQTTSLNLSPQYVYEQNQPQRLTGYQAENAVTVTVRDVARLGQTVDAVTAGGANQVNGISFSLADPKPAQDDARRAAVQVLRAKADIYAQAAGLRVIRLVNLSEGDSAPIYQPRPMMMRTMAVQSAPTQVEPGELSVDIRLTAVYELGQ